MKILHVVPSLALRHGGVSVSVRELCLELARMDHKVQIGTTRRGYDPLVDKPADDQLVDAGVKIHYFPVHPWHWLGQRYEYSPALGNFLSKAIPQVELVHIHSVWSYPTAAAARICQHSKIPYILSPCGALDPYGFRVRGILKRLYGFGVMRPILSRATMIHFTSSMEKRCAWTFGVNVPSTVIPRLIRIGDVPELPLGIFRKRHLEVGDRKILLFLGRLHAKKRLDLVADAFIDMARRHSDTHLVVAGPEGGAGSQVHKTLREAGVIDRVTFTGFLTGLDKWAAFRDSSLFLLPSEDENFGVAALEALAAGLPVLLSPHVAIAENIVQTQAGRVLSLDPILWADTIEKLLGDPMTLTSMGAAGRHLVATEFSSDRIVAAMRDMYAAILSGKRIDAA